MTTVKTTGGLAVGVVKAPANRIVRTTVTQTVECVASPTGRHRVTLVDGGGVACDCYRIDPATAESLAAMGQPVCLTVAKKAASKLREGLAWQDRNNAESKTLWGVSLVALATKASDVRTKRENLRNKGLSADSPQTNTMDDRRTALMKRQLWTAIEEMNHGMFTTDSKLAETINALVGAVRWESSIDSTNAGTATNAGTVKLGHHTFARWHHVDDYGRGEVSLTPPRERVDPWTLWTTRNGYCLACKEKYAKPGTHRNGAPHIEAVTRLCFRAWGKWMVGARRRVWMANGEAVRSRG